MEINYVYVPVQVVDTLVQQTFQQLGCHAEECASMAEYLTGANLRGHDSHGVVRVPAYVKGIQEGGLKINQQVQVLVDNEAILILDGGKGLGQSIGKQTVALGVKKAKQYGVAVTALRNSGHLGRIGEWAEQAAAANLVSLHLINIRGVKIVAPFGGVDRRTGTNPVCWGSPRPGKPPLVLDVATSLVAEGKAIVAFKGGKPLPEGSIISPEGTLTNDPAVYFRKPEDAPGALTAFGLHKGSGMNFFLEIFGGILTGSGAVATTDEPKRTFGNGMLSIFLSVDHFHSDNWFAQEMKGFIDYYKSARPATPGGEVLVPGEIEFRFLEERTRTGLPLPPEIWEELVQTAQSVGVPESEIQAAQAASRSTSLA